MSRVESSTAGLLSGSQPPLGKSPTWTLRWRALFQVGLATKMTVLVSLLTLSGLGALIALSAVARDNEVQLAALVASTYQDMARISTQCITDNVTVVDRQLELVKEIRSAQEQFHLQVLDWKSLLLRGKRPDQRELYTAKFNAHAQYVRANCARAAALLGHSTPESSTVHQFEVAYDKLLTSYHNGLGMIALADSYAEGAASADDYMNERDAEPQAILDRLVVDVTKQANRQISAAVVGSLDRVSVTTRDGSDHIDQANSVARKHTRDISLAVGCAMLVFLALSIRMVRFGLRPLRDTVQALDAMAAGDLRRPILPTGSDEIGHMTKALGRAMDGTRSSIERMAQDIQTVSEAVVSLKSTGVRLGSQVDRALSETGASSAAGEQIATSSTMVSSSIEELAQCVQEIASSCSKAAQTGNKAVQDATTAEHALRDLKAHSENVAEVTNAIATVAAQTNLLALNATIEAARAGDAGRGFAVVANEVKQLARRTSTMTTEIGARMLSIQSVTGKAVSAIDAIVSEIKILDGMIVAIASAVEEQVATTTGVAHNMNEIANATKDISRHLNEAKATADSVNLETRMIGEAAVRLEEVVDQQRIVIGRFRR
jgi:methyl-accepting chemotaxis protein